MLISLLTGCGISSGEFKETDLTLKNSDYLTLAYHEQFQTDVVHKSTTDLETLQKIQGRSQMLKHRVNRLKQSRTGPKTRKPPSEGVTRN